jgi:hypothetical protein
MSVHAATGDQGWGISMSDRDSQTTSRAEVLMDIFMFLLTAWGIAYSDTQAQSATFGFLCGGNFVFAIVDYRDYLRQKLEAIQNGA